MAVVVAGGGPSSSGAVGVAGDDYWYFLELLHWSHPDVGMLDAASEPGLLLRFHLRRGVVSVAASAAVIDQTECSVPEPVHVHVPAGLCDAALHVPCCDLPNPHLNLVDATFGVVAFGASVGGGVHFSRDIRVVIAADGWTCWNGIGKESNGWKYENECGF